MTRESTNRDVQELYPESDAATKRDLEGLANAISQFRLAAHHVAERCSDSPADWEFERALQRRRRAQRRMMLEWAVAAVLLVAMLVPGVGYYRHRAAQARAAQQAQILKQREADAALLDQVASEVSETTPDAMRPLVEMDVAYRKAQGSTQQMEGNHARNE